VLPRNQASRDRHRTSLPTCRGFERPSDMLRFCWRHCCTAVSSPNCFRQKCEASGEQAFCSCEVPIWPCAKDGEIPANSNVATKSKFRIPLFLISVALGRPGSRNVQQLWKTWHVPAIALSWPYWTDRDCCPAAFFLPFAGPEKPLRPASLALQPMFFGWTSNPTC
jgi:hypothetical protein